LINPGSLKTPGARALALDILAAARRRGGSVEDLLAATLKAHPGLGRPERAFLLPPSPSPTSPVPNDSAGEKA
jgi:hypothetical protein